MTVDVVPQTLEEAASAYATAVARLKAATEEMQRFYRLSEVAQTEWQAASQGVRDTQKLLTDVAERDGMMAND